MIHVKCSICQKRSYYKNAGQLMNDLRMVKTSKRKIICDQCLAKGMNQ